MLNYYDFNELDGIKAYLADELYSMYMCPHSFDRGDYTFYKRATDILNTLRGSPASYDTSPMHYGPGKFVFIPNEEEL